ncbi:unnamed protein product [[Actinomadura] parvosata subsp. kistnae]|nr:unnamed protein product [Actinomadura parvosata subsp. kistnae]
MDRHATGLLSGHGGCSSSVSGKKAADAHDSLRGEGAGLEAPAAAAKKEPAQHAMHATRRLGMHRPRSQIPRPAP